jgi:hypothetical protein
VSQLFAARSKVFVWCDLRCWHVSDPQQCPPLGRYQGQSGRRANVIQGPSLTLRVIRDLFAEGLLREQQQVTLTYGRGRFPLVLLPTRRRPFRSHRSTIGSYCHRWANALNGPPSCGGAEGSEVRDQDGHEVLLIEMKDASSRSHSA